MSQNHKNVSRVFEVTIAGIPLKLKSDKNPETVKHLVSFVDKKIHEALPATKTGSVQNAALLALLNLAEELFGLKANALNQLEKFERKTLKIIEELESSKVQAKVEKPMPGASAPAAASENATAVNADR